MVCNFISVKPRNGESNLWCQEVSVVKAGHERSMERMFSRVFVGCSVAGYTVHTFVQSRQNTHTQKVHLLIINHTSVKAPLFFQSPKIMSSGSHMAKNYWKMMNGLT